MKQQQDFEARQKEFQRVMTWAEADNPTIMGWPYARGNQHRLVTKETYETLLRYVGSSLELQPALAQSWEISPDNTVITFHLRHGVTFYPSGDTFNAAAAKFSIDAGFTGWTYQIFGPAAWLKYDRTDVIDDYTIRVQFKTAPSWIIRTFADIHVTGMMNPKFINAHGGVPKDESSIDPYLIDHQDVTGAYILNEYKNNDHIVLKRNPTYWQANITKQSETILIRIIPDPTTRMALIAKGDVDIASLDLRYVQQFKEKIQNEKLPISLDDGPTMRQQEVLFDSLNPPTNDIHIRRMFALSFNYQQFIDKILNGFADRLISFVPKGMPGYQPDVPYYSFDLDKAKQELGLAAPQNRSMVMDGIKVEYVPATTLIGREGFLMWKSDLAKIGVNLILDEITGVTNSNFRSKGGARMIESGWLPDYPDPSTFYAFLDPNYYLARNYGATNSLVGQLLQKSAFESDWQQRLQYYRQVEQWAYDSIPYVKIASYRVAPYYTLVRQWVKGYQPSLFPDYKPTFMELWKELPAGSSPGSAGSIIQAAVCKINRERF